MPPPAPQMSPAATDQRTVAAVLAIGTAMATTRDHTQMLAAVIDAICSVIDATSGGFMHHDPGPDELVLQAPAFGVHTEATVALYRVSLADGGNAARVFLSREPYIANDAQADPRFIQRFVRLFDTHNTLTVPLVLRDRAIGIFHAINKRSGDFTFDDRDVLSAVAPLLAAGLQSALMFRAVEQERRQLERSMYTHERLLDAAISAEGVEALCATLQQLLSRPLLLFDGLRQPLTSIAWCVDPALVARDLRDGQVADGHVSRLSIGAGQWQVAVVGIALAGARGGYLLIDETAQPLDAIDFKAIEQAATLIAVELFKRRSLGAAEQRAAGALLIELFSAGLERARASALLERLGLPVRGPWRVVAIGMTNDGPDPIDDTVHRHGVQIREALERTLGGLRHRARLLHWRAGFVVIAESAAAERFAERGLGRRLQQTLDKLDGLRVPLRLLIGIGRIESDAAALGAALASAEQARDAVTRLAPRGHALSFEDLGVYRLLLGTNGVDEHAAFAAQVLAPVLVPERATLYETLRVLVAEGFVLTRSAEVLGVHLNTVKYRLQQLRDVFARDPGHGELRLEIELAFKIQGMRNNPPV